MEAVEFLKNFDMMCTENSSLYSCSRCNASECCIYGKGINPKKLVEAVEEWSQKHKPKTRQSEFLRQYPRAVKDTNDILVVCPNNLDKNFDRCVVYTYCTDCRKDYWLTEVEQ